MVSPLLLLDKVLTLIALRRLGAACLHVINPYFDSKLLLAVLALFRSHVTIFFMTPELCSHGCMRTELTLDGLVRRLFVLFAICLCNHVTALTTLVIISSATDFMHPHLTDFDGSLTC